MADCSCSITPPLDCPCCCQQRATLMSLIKRVNGYECYLRNAFLIPASCQGLSAGTLYTNIIGGNNPLYRLSYVNNAVSQIRLWTAIGCNCAFIQYLQPLHKTLNNCWGAMPVTFTGSAIPILDYLSETYGASCPSQTVALLVDTDTMTNTLLSIRGAVDWAGEVRKIYGSILSSLPC